MSTISPMAAPAATTQPAPRFFTFGISDSTAVRNPKPGSLESMTNLTVHLSPKDEVTSGAHSSQTLLVAPDGQSWDEVSATSRTFDATDLASKPVASLAAAIAKAGIAELALTRRTNEIGDGTEEVSWGVEHTSPREHAAPAELPTNVRAVYDAALAVIGQRPG